MAIALSFGSCYYDTYPEATVPDEVSYEVNIQPLWNNACVECHNGNVAPDLRPATSYRSLIDGGFVVPGNADESILFLSFFEGTGISLMPPKPNGPWPIENSNLVGAWINQGALDN